MTFEELWNSQQYTDDPNDKVFAEHFYFQGRKTVNDFVVSLRSEIFDNNQQLKLKDQKIDHITFMAERSDEELITIRARVAELEAVLRECREALVKNIVGTGGRTPAAHEAIAKIDEVLNVPDNSRTA